MAPFPSAPHRDGREQTGAQAAPADVEMQKLTPCGEAAVVGNSPGMARGAGNRWLCSILVVGAMPRAVVWEPLKLRDDDGMQRRGALVLT